MDCINGIQSNNFIMFIQSIIFIFFISFSLTACAADNDFNIVCDIFRELQNKSDLVKLTPQQRETFVTKRVNKTLKTSSAARISWKAIVSAEPDQRYEIYQDGAEDVLSKVWKCEAMRRLASTTGE